MKICFISPNGPHMEKWCRWFSQNGHQIDVISFDEAQNPYARVHIIPTGVNAQTASQLQKLTYLTHCRTVKKLVKLVRPDVIHVHFASSYGGVAALAGLGRYILSVWGSDIYGFPKKSFLHRKLLEFSLRSASALFSTSEAMASEAKKYTDKPIEITPFGVDMDLFRPKQHGKREEFVIGTVKSLVPTYGIEYLLRAVAVLHANYPAIPFRLRIAGGGAWGNEYKRRATELGISDITEWLGVISQTQAAMEWAGFDVAVMPSLSESFGVAAVEAQACGVPVIVSDAPGFLETTCPEVSSIVVPRRDVSSIVDAILRLYHDAALRKEMGNAGRRYVLKRYDMDRCYGRIEKFYERFASMHNVSRREASFR